MGAWKGGHLSCDRGDKILMVMIQRLNRHRLMVDDGDIPFA